MPLGDGKPKLGDSTWRSVENIRRRVNEVQKEIQDHKDTEETMRTGFTEMVVFYEKLIRDLTRENEELKEKLAFYEQKGTE